VFPMQSNPLMMLVQAMNSGRNPMQMMQQMAGQDPRIAQAMQMMQGKNAQQLQSMAQNMARERGIDLNQMIRDLGMGNPSHR